MMHLHQVVFLVHEYLDLVMIYKMARGSKNDEGNRKFLKMQERRVELPTNWISASREPIHCPAFHPGRLVQKFSDFWQHAIINRNRENEQRVAVRYLRDIRIVMHHVDVECCLEPPIHDIRIHDFRPAKTCRGEVDGNFSDDHLALINVMHDIPPISSRECNDVDRVLY